MGLVPLAGSWKTCGQRQSDTDVKPGMQMGQVPNGFKPLIQAVGGSVNSLLRSRDRCAAGLEGSSAQVLRA
jgi:predicted component of type VI protein secretion system